MKGTYLGEFEELVLLAIGVLFDNAYGVAIKKELEEQTKRTISIGAIHAACNRLEDKGFLESRFSEPSKTRGGKKKKLYTVTRYGQRALADSRDLRMQMWSRIPKIAFKLDLS